MQLIEHAIPYSTVQATYESFRQPLCYTRLSVMPSTQAAKLPEVLKQGQEEFACCKGLLAASLGTAQ